MQEGVHLAKTGNKTEAFGFFAEITGFDETFEPAWLWLASLAEEPAATRDYLKRVLTLNPANQNAKSWLERLPRESAPQPTAVVAVVPPAASAPVSTPTTPVALPTVEPALPPETPPAFPVRHKGLVLTIDDSSIIRQAVVLTLEKEGFKVLEAENGMEALTILNDIVPDLILLDINMPMMDGYEVCKVIRKSQHARHVPVVMLSGKDGFFDKVKGKMAGSTEYLTKPFNPEQLRKTVEKHVQAAKPEEVIPGRSVFRLV
ncbi:MAG: response regulator [Blastocatellia bacterium]|nr:response regulator [Blastocatellia bacterium]